MTEAVAREYGAGGIWVNSVHPGAILTPMAIAALREAFDDGREVCGGASRTLDGGLVAMGGSCSHPWTPPTQPEPCETLVS